MVNKGLEDDLALDLIESLAKVRKRHKYIDADRFVAVFSAISGAIVAFESDNE